MHASVAPPDFMLAWHCMVASAHFAQQEAAVVLVLCVQNWDALKDLDVLFSTFSSCSGILEAQCHESPCLWMEGPGLKLCLCAQFLKVG